MRTILISFEDDDHKIRARNSNVDTDIVKLELEFHLDEFGIKQKAVVLRGTQNAINAIGDGNPLPITGESGVVDFDTPEGVVEVTIDFGGTIDLYSTYRIFSTLTDHRGWMSVNLLERWTNFIMTEESKPIATNDTNSEFLAFVHPSQAQLA